MIKNIVFDFGQVIVRWNPLDMVRGYVDDPDDAALLADVVFDRLYWDKLDAGTVSDGEVIAAIRARIPERLWEVSERIFTEPAYEKPEVEGVYELVKRISEDKSKRLFLLSNLSKTRAAQADRVRAVHLIENRVFSSLCGSVKPDRKIFEYLCQAYNIKPEETLFIDDNPGNIEGARNYGIEGYLFDGDVNRLEEYLYPNENNRD